MKVSVGFTIEMELLEKLNREPNKSRVVNEALAEWFARHASREELIKRLKGEITKREEELTELNAIKEKHGIQ